MLRFSNVIFHLYPDVRYCRYSKINFMVQADWKNYLRENILNLNILKVTTAIGISGY